jgi:hypothetical protein
MITVDELKRVKIFSRLDETELIRLAQKAADVRLAPANGLSMKASCRGSSFCSRAGCRKVKDLLGRQ